MIGFDIEKSEKAVIDRIIKTYGKKIEREIGGSWALVLRLKKSKHGKAFLHEIMGKIMSNKKVFNSKTSDYNLFFAVSETLEKLLNEIKHKMRK